VFLLGDVTKLSNGFYDGKNKSIQLSKSFLLEKRVNTDEMKIMLNMMQQNVKKTVRKVPFHLKNNKTISEIENCTTSKPDLQNAQNQI
jgi:hypothetical protein